MSDSGEDEKLTEEEREKKRHRKRRAAPGWGKQGKYETDPSTGEQLYRDGSGMLYEWDSAKKAWFPRIDDDFMAQYQAGWPDGCSQLFSLYEFGPSGLRDYGSATLPAKI